MVKVPARVDDVVTYFVRLCCLGTGIAYALKRKLLLVSPQALSQLIEHWKDVELYNARKDLSYSISVARK